MRPRKPANSGGVADRVGEFYWRHSTDSADLGRVNEVLCDPYDGVLIVTFKCYTDDSEVCDYVYKVINILKYEREQSHSRETK